MKELKQSYVYVDCIKSILMLVQLTVQNRTKEKLVVRLILIVTTTSLGMPP